MRWETLQRLLRRPLLFAPLFGAGFALMLVPFAVADTEQAAAFYGSFLAAIVAAFSVVVSIWYQFFLAHKREQHQKEERTFSDALEMFYWACGNLTKLSAAERRLLMFIELATTRKILLAEVREAIIPIPNSQVTERVKVAAMMPPEIATQILPILHALAYESNLEIRLSRYRDDAEIPATVISRSYHLFGTLKRNYVELRKSLRDFLLSKGAVEESVLKDLENLVDEVADQLLSKATTKDA